MDEYGLVGTVSDVPIERENMSEQPLILGVSAYYHDSAAALVRGSEIVAAASEERFTRKKGDSDLPLNAIEYALKVANAAPEDLAAVVFYESPFAKLDRLLATQLVGDLKTLPTFVNSMRTWLPNKLWVESHLKGVLGKKTNVLFSDHHLSHAASCFFPSPFNEAAVLTVDGVGEWSTTTISHGSGSDLQMIEHIEYPNSLGILYSAFTLYAGFKINSGEYKLMGLAPFGKPVYAERILEELIYLDSDGSFSLNPEYFSYFGGMRTYNRKFEELFGFPTRAPDSQLEPHHADLAASIQFVTNQAMLGLARRAKTATGSSSLALAGGVALNVVSVGELERSGIFENVWIQPAAGDAGGALGAALWAAHELYDAPRVVNPEDSMQGAFLGPRPGDCDVTVEKAVSDYGLVTSELEENELAEFVAEKIAEGLVVALARGRMEFGPRALGSRSVIADARDPEMQSRLNQKTKFREGFRPFAPLVLTEDADKYFDTGSSISPYMLKTYPVKESIRTELVESGETNPFNRVREVRSTIPAVTHVDYSARVQTVDSERHPFLHGMLQKFKDITGCSVVVNTSFNVRGEPIVCTAVDAIECFLATDIDVLVLENHVIERGTQSVESLKPRRASAIGRD